MEETFFESGAAAETKGEDKPQETSAEPGALAVSVDDFSALEGSVRLAVELVKKERHERAAAEERATKAEETLRAQLQAAEKLQSELSAMHAERDQVRQRVGRLLKQLDTLEL